METNTRTSIGTEDKVKKTTTIRTKAVTKESKAENIEIPYSVIVSLRNNKEAIKDLDKFGKVDNKQVISDELYEVTLKSKEKRRAVERVNGVINVLIAFDILCKNITPEHYNKLMQMAYRTAD